MEAARQEDKEAACAILVSLFVGKVAPQAIHDPRYFDRQFGYALTSNDIADAEMLLILDSSLEESETYALIKKLSERNPSMLFDLLRRDLNKRSPYRVDLIGRALAACGAEFTASGRVHQSENARTFGAMLVYFVTRAYQWPQDDHTTGARWRCKLAAETISHIEPLTLVPIFIRELKGENDQCHPSEKIIVEDGWPILFDAFRARDPNAEDLISPLPPC
jgi:hypothetical protein